MRAKGYKPMDYYDNDTELRKAINQIRDNYFSLTPWVAFPLTSVVLNWS